MHDYNSYLSKYLFVILFTNYVFSILYRASAVPVTNVLWLVSDDLGKQQFDLVRDVEHPLNVWLNEETVEFKRAVADMPVCAPSRAGLLTGRTNDRNGGVTFDTNVLVTLFNNSAETIFGYFTKRGYSTTAIGKIEHPTLSKSMFKTGQYTIAPQTFAKQQNNECGNMNVACIINTMIDDQIVDKCIARLTSFAKQPNIKFFLGCGFYNPHYPWRTTKENYNKATDAMPLQYTKIKLTQEIIKRLQEQQDVIMPVQAPQINGISWEMNGHNYDASLTLKKLHFPFAKHKQVKQTQLKKIPSRFYNDKIQFAQLRKLLRGTLLTNLDHQYKVIQAVYKLGLQDSTVIVLTGDHGIGYGQLSYDVDLNRVNGMWSKNTLLPEDSYIPLFWYVPGITNNKIPNKQTFVPASIIDIPTTVHYLLFKQPMPSGNLPVDGKDLTPWIVNPQLSDQAEFVISQYPAGSLSKPQYDPLMNSKVSNAKGQCKSDKPGSGRIEWCNMRYKIDTTIDNTQYSLHVIFPYYEQRVCLNPKFPFETAKDKWFANGKLSWQILPTSCFDSDSPTQMMLFSNLSADLGRNLLQNQNEKKYQDIKNKLLNKIITTRKFKACKTIPKRPSYSTC